MKNAPGIVDVMTADPETVETTVPVSEVLDLLGDRNYHHVPVVDGRTPIGIISATDILKLVYDVDGGDDRVLRTFLDHQFNIEDAMSTELVTVSRDGELSEVVDAMKSGKIHSVLVVDDDGGLVGIVTSTDLIKLLGDLL